MGTCQTPARVRAVLLPPRPVPRPAPISDRTRLRSREDSCNKEGSEEEGSEEQGANTHGDERVAGSHDLMGVCEREPLVAPAMAAVSRAEAETPSALPAVAPRPDESLPRHLIECRVSVI